jgi:hypothetical protein
MLSLLADGMEVDNLFRDLVDIEVEPPAVRMGLEDP